MLARIVDALRFAVTPELLPSLENYARAFTAVRGYVPGDAMARDHAAIVAGAAAIPDLFQAPAVLDVLEAHHWIPESLFSGSRLTFRPAREHEHKAKRGEYAVPAGHTLHTCSFTERPFLLPEGGLCPVLEYEREHKGKGEQSPEDAEIWYYVVHPALVIAGPEAVHAAMWDHIANACRGLGETLLEIEQATQVVGDFDPTGAAAGWPSRAFQTWEAVPQDGGGTERELRPCGFLIPERKAA